ncbi:hypothetical protein ON010_g3969 [Phytophthora cinnamomi]|nr:hypothetical protein ON010_g3969 [Phytophthora cinnamomi]
MPRVHKAAHWSFVKVVTPSAHLHPVKVKWSSSGASSAYCTECKVSFSFKSGSSADIRKHLSEKHPEILIKARGVMPRKCAAKLVYEAIASKRKSSMPFLSPAKRSKKASPAEEEMITRVLVNWISNNLRPLGIIEDKELRVFSTLIQALNGIYEMPSRRTITERLQPYAQQKRNDLKVGIVASE